MARASRAVASLGDPNADRLVPRPELQVVGPVVRPHAVDVMDVLVGKEGAAEDLLHDEPMLLHAPVLRGGRMLREVHPDVPVRTHVLPAGPPAALQPQLLAVVLRLARPAAEALRLGRTKKREASASFALTRRQTREGAAMPRLPPLPGLILNRVADSRPIRREPRPLCLVVVGRRATLAAEALLPRGAREHTPPASLTRALMETLPMAPGSGARQFPPLAVLIHDRVHVSCNIPSLDQLTFTSPEFPANGNTDGEVVSMYAIGWSFAAVPSTCR